ncbi:MAG: hypothetical protein P8M78_11555, partial [Myxococcota bacterium]|nr:hypothetical protein [Myxococcota bacterium]
MLDAATPTHDSADPIVLEEDSSRTGEFSNPAPVESGSSATKDGAVSTVGADPAAQRDTLQLYLSWIRDIPLLDRQQAGELSAE